jgi:hypothetical protein
MPLLKELTAFLLPWTYKDVAPTELITRFPQSKPEDYWLQIKAKEQITRNKRIAREYRS